MRAVKAVEGPNGLRRVRETERRGAGTPLTRSRTWQVMGSFGLLVMVAGMSVEGSFGWGSDWLALSMLRVDSGLMREDGRWEMGDLKVLHLKVCKTFKCSKRS